MKTTIVYHNADLDGFCSGAIAKKSCLDKGIEFEMVGWNYGDPIPKIEGQAILVDISFPPDVMDGLMITGLTWIDHHKSAIEAATNRPHGIAHGVTKIGDSASLLAWKYFYPDNDVPPVVYWVDRYDVWKQGDDWDTVMMMQYGMRNDLRNPDSHEEFKAWNYLLNDTYGVEMSGIKQIGEVIFNYEREKNKVICSRAFDLIFEGLKFAAINIPLSGSAVFDSYRRPEHQGLMVFCYTGKDWTVSMYKNELNEGVDLSLIAVKYGGGGHASSCGFRVDDIQTILNI